MFKDIIIGQFIPGNSFIHKLNPAVKLLLTLLFIITMFIINSPLAYIAATVFLWVSVYLCKIPFRFIAKGIKPMLYIFIFTAFFNLFFTAGTPLWEISFFGFSVSVTLEGIILSIKMIIRLLYLVVASSVLTLTTSPLMLTDGIEKLISPLSKVKVPTHEIAMMMSIALRFIPTLSEEMDKIMKAQTARGADFENGNIIKRAKALIPILVPLFISAFRRADELAVAMESRCYTSGEGRTKMKEQKVSRRDFIAGLAFILFLAVSVILEIIY